MERAIKNIGKSARKIGILHYGLIIIMLVPIMLVIQHFISGWRWVNEPVHSSIEAFGAAAALIVAFILTQSRDDESLKDISGPAMGLLGMGILGGFHALTEPGQSFVFLLTIGEVIGGIGFFLIWFPSFEQYISVAKRVTIGLIIIFMGIGFWGLNFKETLPIMVLQGDFTPLAMELNIIAGIFFFLAAIRIYVLYKRANNDVLLLLFCMTILFGIGSVTFKYSELWDASWWIWHLLRLFAYCLAIFLGVKTYRRAQRRMKINQERLDLAMSVTNDGIWDWDIKENTMFFGDRYYTMAGYEPNDFESSFKEWEKRIHLNDIEEYKSLIQECLAGNRSDFAIEFRFLRKDNTFMWIAGKGEIVACDEAGNPSRFLGIHSDISSRKLTEIELAQSIIKAERMNQKLTQQNEEMKQFAYIISHDLRAPLVNLKGFTGELKYSIDLLLPFIQDHVATVDPHERQKIIEAIEEDIPEAMTFIANSVTRMDGYISAVLKLSRLGRTEINFEALDCNALIHKIVDSITHEMVEKNIKVSIGDLPQVKSDKMALEQIFGNILDNAVKYTDEALQNYITITAEKEDEEIIFSFEDSGRGIKVEDMEKIFAIFRRAGTQDRVGEGMGMAYTQTLVRRLGGKIWCESEFGKGSTFFISLPSSSWDVY